MTPEQNDNSGSSSQSVLARTAAGGVGAGVGGAFSYVLFDKMDVAALISRGTVYGIVVFSIVALIVLITGYVALPNKPHPGVQRAMICTMVFLAVITTFGFGFQMWEETLNPKVLINATFAPDLDAVNRQIGLSNEIALTADLDDHHGHIQHLIHDKDVQVAVGNTWEITLQMERLDQVAAFLQRKLDDAANKAKCNGDCSLVADGGDNVDPHH